MRAAYPAKGDEVSLALMCRTLYRGLEGPGCTYLFSSPRSTGTGTDAEDNMDLRCGECVVSWFASVKVLRSKTAHHTLSPPVSISSNSEKRRAASGNPLAAPDASRVARCGHREKAGGPRIRMYIFAVCPALTMREERAVEGPGSTSSNSAATGGERIASLSS